jgi:hypothetical protein
MDKVTQVVVFSSTAIALYGYDQGKKIDQQERIVLMIVQA